MLIFVLLALCFVVWIMATYLFVKKQTLRCEPSSWSLVKIPYGIALVPLVLLWQVWIEELIGMKVWDETLSQMNPSLWHTLLKTGVVMAGCIGLLLAILLYKNIFSIARLQRFIFGVLVGFGCFMISILALVFGYQMLTMGKFAGL